MCPIASFLWAEFVFAQVLVLRVHCVSEIDLREWSVPPSQVLFCLFFAAFPRKGGGRDRGEAHCDSLRFRRAALSMPHRVHRQPKRDEFGVVAVVFWGASGPSGARCSPCAPARATSGRGHSRGSAGGQDQRASSFAPFPDPNPRLRHRLLTLAHALARLTNPAPPQISPRPDL